MRSLLKVFSNSHARVGVLASMPVFFGQFVGYTYLVPYLRDVAQVQDSGITGVLLVFGVAGVIGNFATGFTGQLSVRGVVTVAIVLLAASVGLAPVVGTSPAGAITLIAVSTPTGMAPGQGIPRLTLRRRSPCAWSYVGCAGGAAVTGLIGGGSLRDNHLDEHAHRCGSLYRSEFATGVLWEGASKSDAMRVMFECTARVPAFLVRERHSPRAWGSQESICSLARQQRPAPGDTAHRRGDRACSRRYGVTLARW
ncbi:hypothetical protein C8K30_1154 [Promicromonospora sp. AC04]|nr:hypothetical protein C8K30_1154 [Promicromonospora sp. AC04]